MKRFSAIAVAALVISVSQADAAPVISFAQGGSAVSGNIIQDFNSFADGASIGNNAFAFANSSAIAAKPAFGSTGNFASVETGGIYSVAFAATNKFSFVLGSLDSYNALTLMFADNSTLTYNGSAITGGGLANGDQSSPFTNGVVSFSNGTGPKIVGATFTSGQNAFEFDNLAAGVPEPASWALMIVGFGLVGAAMRRRPLQAGSARTA